jgi:D-3-phosphoglycerate dehydrogenase / 2-oxoglutarate reductase
MSVSLPVVLALGAVDEDIVAPILLPHARLVSNPSPEERVGAVGAIVRAHVRVDSTVLDSLPALRVIARTGVGTERVDVAEATRRGIPVIITPGSNTEAVAEGALAHLLSLTKSLGPHTRLVRDDRWAERDSHPVGDLRGGTLAILGFGRIGRRVANLATAFGMTVIAYDPYVDSTDVPRAHSISEAVAEATHISVHLPATEETRGLIDHALIQSLRPGTILVNLARGDVVDLDALLGGLESGHLGGVGLDVFAEEPPAHHPLFDHPRVVLTPHMMGLSTQSTAETFRQAAQGIADFLAGKTPQHVATA